jgi:hypothetical protein
VIHRVIHKLKVFLTSRSNTSYYNNKEQKGGEDLAIVFGRGEVQSTLNQKVGSKSSRTVDFVSRFIFLIKFKFKIRTFNNHYESRYKINGSRRF